MAIEARRNVRITSESIAEESLNAGIPKIGGTVTETSSHVIEAQRGSQAAIRGLGGYLVSLDKFPVKARIDLTTDEIGPKAEIHVEENFGFGTTLGVRKKYQRACDKFADEIAALIG